MRAGSQELSEKSWPKESWVRPLLNTPGGHWSQKPPQIHIRDSLFLWSALLSFLVLRAENQGLSEKSWSKESWIRPLSNTPGGQWSQKQRFQIIPSLGRTHFRKHL